MGAPAGEEKRFKEAKKMKNPLDNGRPHFRETPSIRPSLSVIDKAETWLPKQGMAADKVKRHTERLAATEEASGIIYGDGVDFPL